MENVAKQAGRAKIFSRAGNPFYSLARHRGGAHGRVSLCPAWADSGPNLIQANFNGRGK